MAIAVSNFNIASFVYDFAIDGGAQGTIQSGKILPDDALIFHGMAFVTTALAGGGASIAVGFGASTTALIGATGVASWGLGAMLPGVDLPASPVRLTSGNTQLNMTISGADLSAGVFVYQCLYYLALAS